MTTKVVMRLLDAEGRLLGSVVHYATVKGDGCLRAAGPVVCGIAQTGAAAQVSLHWADVNVEARVSWARPVVAGEIVELFAGDEPLIVVGPMPGPLPPIVVGAVTVNVPLGGVGAKAH